MGGGEDNDEAWALFVQASFVLVMVQTLIRIIRA